MFMVIVMISWCPLIPHIHTQQPFNLNNSVIKNLEHKHIVSIYGIIEHGPFICVFMDYCRYGDLLDRIKNHGVLSEKHTQIYFSQLVSAINYLHSNNISHRDVKCENVLLVNRYNVKLTDFTFARHFKEKSYLAFSETYCGSTAYASPEVLKVITFVIIPF